MKIGLQEGFQWLDGSFLEDIERTGKRPPGDIDVVTFFKHPANLDPNDGAWDQLVQASIDLFDPSKTKMRFNCDAYFVDLHLPAEHIVDRTRYWFGLFSHRRTTLQWKGLLEVPLGDRQGDAKALALIQSKGES